MESKGVWLTGEGVAADELCGDAELASELTDFVLEEFAEGLDELEAMATHQALGDTTDVVMSFDSLGGALEGNTFDHILD